MKSSKPDKGFTLIELLVVIAIIAILAAILFPVFTSAKQSANAVKCLSNCRQIGMGLNAYAQDYDGTLPTSAFWQTVGTQKSAWGWEFRAWMDAIMPYVKNYQVFVCPSRPKEGLGVTWPGQGTLTRPIGYAVNGHFIRQNAFTLSQIRQSSKCIAVGEMRMGVYETAIWYYIDLAPVARIHSGKCNFVFADGHAASLRLWSTVYPTVMWNVTGTYPFEVWPGATKVQNPEAVQTWVKNTFIVPHGDQWPELR